MKKTLSKPSSSISNDREQHITLCRNISSAYSTGLTTPVNMFVANYDDINVAASTEEMRRLPWESLGIILLNCKGPSVAIGFYDGESFARSTKRTCAVFISSMNGWVVLMENGADRGSHSLFKNDSWSVSENVVGLALMRFLQMRLVHK